MEEATPKLMVLSASNPAPAPAETTLPKAVLKGRFRGHQEGAVPMREIEPVAQPARGVSVSLMLP